MADVSTFNLDGTDINVKDSTARSSASAAQSAVSGLADRVAVIEGLSRLTVSYANEKITFTSTTH